MNSSQGRLMEFLHRPAFLRCCVFVVFLKTIWDMWVYKDITSGDTASYFRIAYQFAQDGSNNIAWSAPYTSLLGFVYRIVQDPYLAIIFHRIIILAAITVLMFEVTRRLLSPAISFLLVIWWWFLPINFDSLYEVHLFAFVPLLLILYITLKFQGLWARALALAGLGLTTILVRNEYLIATSFFGFACLLADFVLPVWRHTINSKWQLLKPALAYFGCAIVSILVVAWVYSHSTKKYEELKLDMHGKHVVNISQILTYNYQQRTGDYSFSPWTEYKPYMISRFGKAELSLGEAFQANPMEVTRHFLWNLHLVPNGLELALFSKRGGKDDPDYYPSRMRPVAAYSLSFILLAGLSFGIYSCRTLKDEDKFSFITNRFWTWTALIGMTATTSVVVIMQRPRPSYMFILTYFIMLLAGVALVFILKRYRVEKIFNRFFPLAALVLTLLYPCFWLSLKIRYAQRPILAQVRLLEKSGILRVDDQLIGTFGYNSFEMTAYPWGTIGGIDIKPFLAKSNTAAAFNTELERNKVRYILTSATLLKNAMTQLGVTALNPPEWKLIAQLDDHGENYYLFDRDLKQPASVATFQLK